MTPSPMQESNPGKRLKVSIVLPTLNEEGGIGPTIEAIDRAAFERAGWDLEILVVDGDSKDRTREEAERRGARVLVEKRRGYGRAYKTGLPAATGDIIVNGTMATDKGTATRTAPAIPVKILPAQ